MKSKSLVLMQPKDAYYFGLVHDDAFDIDEPFKRVTGIFAFLLKVFRRFSIPLTSLFYGEWYKRIKEYDKIILFDFVVFQDEQLLFNIAKKAPESRRFIYYWNIIKDEARYVHRKELADKTGFSLYHYDHGNCERFNMKFNTIMYYVGVSLPERPATADLLFLGFVKDRGSKLNNLYRTIQEAGFTPRFVIVKADAEAKKYPFEFHDRYIPYMEYLDMVAESRGILDIAQENQDGFSMRVMEAIFLNKKLVSTNTALKDASFYDPANILVLDSDEVTRDQIAEFFASEFHPYSEDVRRYYSIGEWVKRFQ